MKLAAIDIGSNAVRLLLERIIENGDRPLFKKESLVRMPIRLGDDVFVHRRISDAKRDHLIKAMIGFRHLMEAYEAEDYLACATSAMREAENGDEVASAIRAEAGIDLQVIGGPREAEIICSNGVQAFQDGQQSFLFVDVGGGSTEMTLFSNNHVAASHSSDIGTIRMLTRTVAPEAWKEMRLWLRRTTTGVKQLSAIGSGGNINKIFRLARKREGSALTVKKLRQIHEHLARFTVAERIKVLNLRPDRADVIVPASEIFLNVMKWGNIGRIFVPQIGLSDGLIHILYDRARSQAPSRSGFPA